jgi:hypothetical protein
MKVLYGLGLVSILGLVANYKKHGKASVVSYVILFLAIGSAVLSKSVGTSGGEIRHTEIRENANINNGLEVRKKNLLDNDDN